MSKQIGDLPPRYSFILNPHATLRLSSCPICHGLTYPRKFALLIHFEGFGPIFHGKTCKYCSKCELIMCHQNELEAQLATSFAQLRPEVVGNDYMVLGTVDMKYWKGGLTGEATNFAQAMKHTAEFKMRLDLHYDPGGWRPKAKYG